MSPVIDHRIMVAPAWAAPAPFRAFAVRSEEPRHAMDARTPHDRVHLLTTAVLDADSVAALCTDGYARVSIESFSDVDYADTSWPALAALAPGAAGLPERLADALQRTGVLGSEVQAYRDCLLGRVDYLACRGAGFHNDVSRHWSACLFWVLALDAEAVEFVMPHAGLRIAIRSGDLLLFDQTLAHGLCRPQDAGQAVAASFETGDSGRQLFLTGEVLLSDAQWSALGSPWLPVEWHDQRGALDLMVAEFDERSGAIKQLRALRDGMKRSTCHADEPPV